MSGIRSNGNSPLKTRTGNTSATAAQEGGWEFWNRVYQTPDLRNMMQESTESDTSLSSLLLNASLLRAQLRVSNVPRLADSQKAVVRQLIHRDLATNVSILDVRIDNRMWLLSFYRSEDALRVFRAMHGHQFRGRILSVAIGDIVPPEMPRPSLAPLVDEQNVNWCAAEWEDIVKFKRDVVKLLSRHPLGISLSEVLSNLFSEKRIGVVAEGIQIWPSGVVRMLAPKVRLTGSYLSLAEQNNAAHLIKKVAAEGAPRSLLEPWEPLSSIDIRSDQQLVEYIAALLEHYGPQHLDIDVPIRILATILPNVWPKTAREVAKAVVSLSPQFIIMCDVIYLTTSVRNRRVLLEHIQPTVSSSPKSRGKQFNP